MLSVAENSPSYIDDVEVAYFGNRHDNMMLMGNVEKT